MNGFLKLRLNDLFNKILRNSWGKINYEKVRFSIIKSEKLAAEKY